jgi:class 3 adenylate cyclase
MGVSEDTQRNPSPSFLSPRRPERGDAVVEVRVGALDAATPRKRLPNEINPNVMNTTQERDSHNGSQRKSTSLFSRLSRHQAAHHFQSPWRVRLREQMDGVPLTLFWCAFTCVILYSDLIRTALLPPAVDPYFVAFTFVSMVILAVEIAMSSLVRPGYTWRFYMWMDLVALFSLLCDIPAFVDFVTSPFGGDDDDRHLTLERIAKAAQAGARAARIMQVVSVLQLLHLRTQRSRMKRRERRSSGGSGASVGSVGGLNKRPTSSGISDGEDRGKDGQGNLQFQMTTLKPQTRVGEKLTEMTMRKVILGVLILLSMLPVFDAWVYYGTPTSFEDGGLQTLHTLYEYRESDSGAFWGAVEDYRVQNEYKIGGRVTGKLIRLVVHNETIIDEAARFDYLRETEKQSSHISAQTKDEQGPNSTATMLKTESWTDVRWDVQFQSLLDIARVTCLLGMLSIGAVLFIRDADSLVLRPIERMVHKVKIMSENPFASKTFNEDARGDDQAKQLETKVLEHSIGKVCQLLSIGFGEAGAEIIANNIKSGGAINPMLPGKRMHAIFGFCDIRDFTSATEVLQEDIMEFVNCIASIVHEEVSFHGGAANKNIGDAFLMVWRLPDEKHTDEKEGKESQASKTSSRSRGSIVDAKLAMRGMELGSEALPLASHLADAALASMIIIKSALDRSPKLRAFCQREDIQRRMPGFKVNLGMGLHAGWAIEGAIGSHHKIDPSYLSPHVNMAARLEAATKQYGVPILLSDSFVEILTPAVRQRCLAIDTVMVKGSNVPTTLYTVKANFDRYDSHLNDSDPSGALDKRRDMRHATECAGGHISFSDYPYLDELDEHPDLTCTPWMDDGDSIEMLGAFEEAYRLYRAGDFKRSMAVLESRVDPTFGPAVALLGYMQSNPGPTRMFQNGGFVRELTEK